MVGKHRYLVPALIVLLSVAAAGTSAAGIPGEGKTPRSVSHQAQAAPGHDKRDIARAISILEDKTGMTRLPQRAKDKLASMHDNEFKLVMNLCNRMAGSGGKPDSDIALLLATALIVLS